MATSKNTISQKTQEYSSSSSVAATALPSPISKNNQTFLHDIALRNEVEANFKIYVEKLIAKSKIIPAHTILDPIPFLFDVNKRIIEIEIEIEIYGLENTYEEDTAAIDAVYALVAAHLASKGINVTMIPAAYFSDGSMRQQKLKIHSSETLLKNVINEVVSNKIQPQDLTKILNHRAEAGQCGPLKIEPNPLC